MRTPARGAPARAARLFFPAALPSDPGASPRGEDSETGEGVGDKAGDAAGCGEAAGGAMEGATGEATGRDFAGTCAGVTEAEGGTRGFSTDFGDGGEGCRRRERMAVCAGTVLGFRTGSDVALGGFWEGGGAGFGERRAALREALPAELTADTGGKSTNPTVALAGCGETASGGPGRRHRSAKRAACAATETASQKRSPGPLTALPAAGLSRQAPARDRRHRSASSPRQQRAPAAASRRGRP